MQVHNPDHNRALLPGLARELREFRRRRDFQPAVYAQAKAALINTYFSRASLRTAIVGLSGGIDSSVVAGLLAYARKQDGSPLQEILAVTIPAHVSGATGQNSSRNRAHEVMETLGLTHLEIEIAAPHAALTGAVEKALGITGDEWARGQSVAHVRTMALAYCGSLMQMRKTPGIIVGTTNRDEGAYLGYVGKYSDGMVDLQVICDLHKSEVYALARYLKLPQSTIEAIPTGDMYDNRSDTEVFGASYDFVELYLNWLELGDTEKAALRAGLTPEEQTQFDGMAENLENLHRYNAHKYTGNQAGSPAYHMNLLPCGVPGGWQSGRFCPTIVRPPAPEKIFNGYFELSPAFIERAQATPPAHVQVAETVVTTPDDLHPKTCAVLRQLISPDEVCALIAETEAATWVPAGLDGYKMAHPGAPVGSWRATAYSPAYADVLWKRLMGYIPMLRMTPPGSDRDAQAACPDAMVWRAVGVNPALRFIKYEPVGNLLFPHYDAPPTGKDTPTTLDTLVIYLTTPIPDTGGETCFVKDPQAGLPARKRVMNDWDREVQDDEILVRMPQEQGSALVFPHRTLHASRRLAPEGKQKIIVRTDIIYMPVTLP